MRIAVLGTGATAGFFGSRLIELDTHDVTFIVDRPRWHQLARAGLVVASPFGRFRQRVKALLPEHVSAPFEVVLAAPRSHELEAALDASRAAIAPGTVLVTLVEGISHLDLTGDVTLSASVVGTVFEARVGIDADGVVNHRSPAAEVCVGGLAATDTAAVDKVLALLQGRGLRALPCTDIRNKAWERFSYQAAGIASSHLTNMTLRDTLHQPFGASLFKRALEECRQIGLVAGYAPDVISTRLYERALFQESAPIAATPMLDAAGPDGEEAAFLLAEMIGISRCHGFIAQTIECAWKTVNQPQATPVSWTKRRMRSA